MEQKSYRQLNVWQKSMDLVRCIYELTSEFPDDEKYGLISQLKRASVSIPANIAEGYGRVHTKEYIHHVSIARGSLFELETLMIIAVDTEVCDRDKAADLWPLIQEIGRMLTGLLQKLRSAN